MTAHATATGIEIRADAGSRQEEILSAEALDFLAGLHRKFNHRRLERLAYRVERQKGFDAGKLPDFLEETKSIRDADWEVAPIPADLLDRRVEITGPVDRKMIINALNSGAKVFMADFEDASSPTFANMVEGQANLKDRWSGKIDFTDPTTGAPIRHQEQPGCPHGAAARLAPARAPRRRRRAGDVRLAVRFRPLCLPLREGADGAGRDARVLPAEAREQPGGAPVEQRLFPRRARAWRARRVVQGDGADRDAAGRLRDGRNPL